MRITTGRWQHKNCSDLQLEIMKVQYQGPDYTKVKAFYMRKDFGCGEILLDPKADTLKITKDQYKNWRRVS